MAVWPDDGVTGDTLLNSADLAMYAAKRRRSGHAFREADPLRWWAPPA
mgnify:CR=1 FL=1